MAPNREAAEIRFGIEPVVSQGSGPQGPAQRSSERLGQPHQAAVPPGGAEQ